MNSSLPARYFVERGEKRAGPYTGAQLKQLAISGKIRLDDIIADEAKDKKSIAKTVKGLFPVNENKGAPAFDSDATFAQLAIPMTGAQKSRAAESAIEHDVAAKKEPQNAQAFEIGTGNGNQLKDGRVDADGNSLSCCPHCHRRIKSSSNAAGEVAACQRCRGRVRLPHPRGRNARTGPEVAKMFQKLRRAPIGEAEEFLWNALLTAYYDRSEHVMPEPVDRADLATWGFRNGYLGKSWEKQLALAVLIFLGAVQLFGAVWVWVAFSVLLPLYEHTGYLTEKGYAIIIIVWTGLVVISVLWIFVGLVKRVLSALQTPSVLDIGDPVKDSIQTAERPYFWKGKDVVGKCYVACRICGVSVFTSGLNATDGLCGNCFSVKKSLGGVWR